MTGAKTLGAHIAPQAGWDTMATSQKTTAALNGSRMSSLSAMDAIGPCSLHHALRLQTECMVIPLGPMITELHVYTLWP